MKYIFAMLISNFSYVIIIIINKIIGTETNASHFLFIYVLLPVYLLTLGYYRIKKSKSSLLVNYVLIIAIVILNVFIGTLFSEELSILNTLNYMVRTGSGANYILSIEIVALTIGWLLISIFVLNKRKH